MSIYLELSLKEIQDRKLKDSQNHHYCKIIKLKKSLLYKIPIKTCSNILAKENHIESKKCFALV